MTHRDLDPADAQAELQRDPTLRILDVRTDHEFRSGRITGSQHIPVHELPQRIDELDPQANYLVVCAAGVRSATACRFLHQSGFQHLANLAGGLYHWAHAGLPVER